MDINVAHDKFGHIGDKHLRKTLQGFGVEVTGTSSRCEACALSKAKHKVVRKVTQVKATRPGERLFVDIGGPFTKAL